MRRLVLAAIVVMCCVPASAGAQVSYEVLHAFAGAPNDGAAAYSALIEASDGNFYGTTQRGGRFGAGTVYRMTPAGAVTIHYSFTGGTDGSLPAAALVQRDDGNLYGTAVMGGAGLGTVFRISTAGAFTVLHTFAGSTDGATPYAPLIKARDGNFYGVTFGGSTVFRMTPSGTVTTLHRFSNIDGQVSPFAPLVEAMDGNFYGTTRFGVIYRVSAAGDFAVVHRLDSATEGATLDSALVQGADGSFYGTARNGGVNNGGTVFRVTPAGLVTVLHAFSGGADGEGPEAGLIQGPDGAFYGTTANTVAFTASSRVFRITRSGVLTVLHAFAPADSSPYAPLLLASDGRFYGTTIGGTINTTGRSVVFRLAVALPVPAGPFGSLDTPAEGATVAGEVAVTGWALDDTGVSTVDIYRSPLPGEPTQVNGLVLIGPATFVPGARPDVASTFPLHPNNTRGGWGYMLLSNVLPNGGNGTFTISAFARDDSGLSSLLGQKGVTFSNRTSVRPFGTIDTPTQGASVSGVIDNFGWALTPAPASIPANGSTITVYVDGVPIGQPTYNLFRSDIAALFPGYANTNGAVGHFSLDTRTLANGLHTIAWVVTDDMGNTQGIGSRFFTVINP